MKNVTTNVLAYSAIFNVSSTEKETKRMLPEVIIRGYPVLSPPLLQL